MKHISSPGWERLANVLKGFGLTPSQCDQAFAALMGEKDPSVAPFLGLDSKFKLTDGSLTLVPFSLKEVYSEEYLQWMNDPSITQTIGRLDYLLPVGREKLLDYFLSLDRSSTLFLAVYLEGRFVGTFKIYGINQATGLCSFGVLVGSKADWGKGIASRSIALACDYAFRVLGLRKITAGYYASNTGMEKAFFKNGFAHEATFKDQILTEGKFVDHVFVARFRS